MKKQQSNDLIFNKNRNHSNISKHDEEMKNNNDNNSNNSMIIQEDMIKQNTKSDITSTAII